MEDIRSIKFKSQDFCWTPSDQPVCVGSVKSKFDLDLPSKTSKITLLWVFVKVGENNNW